MRSQGSVKIWDLVTIRLCMFGICGSTEKYVVILLWVVVLMDNCVAEMEWEHYENELSLKQ